MIFYGPPGTGKTWTAKKVAKCFTQTKTDDSPDKFIDRIIEEIRVKAQKAKYTWTKATASRTKIFVLIKGEQEIRLDFHESNDLPEKTIDQKQQHGLYPQKKDPQLQIHNESYLLNKTFAAPLQKPIDFLEQKNK